MHLVIAPDKFAGTLTAIEAASAVERGWLRADPQATCVVVPLSDGGPGFVAVLHAALGGKQVKAMVAGPLSERVQAQILLIRDRPPTGRRLTAYVESAQACGLHLLAGDGGPDDTTALTASSTGVGELLGRASELGVDRVVVGVGGTASTDGGRGCLEALASTWPTGIELLIATDVTGPLLGRRGAASTYGPQKGAGSRAVRLLERRLQAWVAQTGGDPDAPRMGAGGGLAYGLSLLGGRPVSGLETVMEAVGLRRAIADAELVITGEGRLDESSVLGKVPGGVAALAAVLQRPCVVLAGDRAISDEALRGTGISEVRTLVEAFGAQAAMADPVDRLAELAERVARARGSR